MGRLTSMFFFLAQFERESLRAHRDKIAASNERGSGRCPLPLGYQIKEDKMAVIEDEAERVRLISAATSNSAVSMHWCETSGSEHSNQGQDRLQPV